MKRASFISLLSSVPAGLRMPAEWEPHEATWIAWPHNRRDWPFKYEPIPFVYGEVVRHLARAETVHIIVNDRPGYFRARTVLSHCDVPLERLEFHRWPTDRVWTRDYGPTFVKSSDHAGVLVSWRFNGWAKYLNWKSDNAIPLHIARHVGRDVLQPTLPDQRKGLVLEGGSIDVNGRGALLTTEECLLSTEIQVRNPGVTREQLESVFAEYLGVSKVIWLKRGIAGDDTHGHIDDIARFVAPDTVVAAVEPNPADANYGPLQENLAQLQSETDQDGHKLRVIELPMPNPVVFRGQRLPASYANFYIANGLVLVPTFNDPHDRIALNTLAEVFPDRNVVGIHCGDLIWGLGAIHCMTQQQPL